MLLHMLWLLLMRLVVMWLLLMRLMLVARIEGLRLARRKRFTANGRLLIVTVVIPVVGNITAWYTLLLLLLVIGLTLPKLLLRRCDQAEIMLGVLIIVFGSDRVSGTLRIAGKLKVLFGDVGCRSSNLHVRSVGLIHSRQGILMMVMTAFAVATPHALVLSVSHGCFSANPLICGSLLLPFQLPTPLPRNP
jgi:hypothetical protein